MKMGLAPALRAVCAAFLATLVIFACTAFAQAPPPQPPPTPSQAQPAASPRDIVGTWQGTLHLAQANRDLRIVNKITKDEKGALKVIFYSIDQGGQPLPATKASFEDGVLKFNIDTFQVAFEGKMSPDGKAIVGNFTQGSPIPFTLERANADTAWAIPEPPKIMPADANPSFDVVTVKPSEPNRPGKGFSFQGRHFRTFNTNVNDLIAYAYGLHAKQIIGAPDWFGTDLYDIDGVPDVEGQPSHKQMALMVQKLLPDRFKLIFHHEKRELSVYILTVAGGGPKMEKTSVPAGNPTQGFGFRALGDLSVRNLNMADFASWMQSGVMDKPVVDQTGLTDKYDFHLKWTPDESQFAQFRGAGVTVPSSTDDPNAPPSLYTAIQEQVGLKITPGKAQDDVIVIDHVEKPTAN